MRRLLFTLFTVLFFALSGRAQQACFKPYIGGREVTVVCVNAPVQFKDCSGNAGAEFYDLDSSNGLDFTGMENSPTRTYSFSAPGTFTVTQLKTVVGQPNSSYPQTFVVKPIPEPTFTATQCGPDTVLVTITDAVYDTYSLIIGNGNPQPVNPNQTLRFQSPGGTYSLSLTGTYAAGNCGISATKTLTAAVAPAMPSIVKLDVLETAASGKIELQVIGLQSGYSYSLEQQNGSGFTQKASFAYSGNPTQTITLTGINTTVPNCFRVRVFDACGRSQHQNPAIPIICSTVMEAVAQNKQNVILWPAYAGNTPANGAYTYQLRRQEGTNSRTFNLPAGQTSYTDTEITCGLEYCYELAVIEGTNVFSLSNTACVTSISTDVPAAAFLVTSFNPDNTVQGTITLPANTNLKEQTVFKNRNSGGYVQAFKSKSNTFLDSDKNVSLTAVCYKVTYADNCGNAAPESNESCPIILEAEQDKGKRTVSLKWTEYVGFTNPSLTYTLEILDENFNIESSQPVTGTFALTDQKLSDTRQILRYRVKATGNTGEISYSNTQTIVQDVKIFIPTAFSPNNDGLNDVFEIKGRFQNNFSLVILNRWGQVAFESNDPKKGWDGKVNGTEAPIGVYAYRLRTTDERGQRYERTGTLTLLR